MRRLPPTQPKPPCRKPTSSCLPRRRSSPPTNRPSSRPKPSRPSHSRPRNPAADSSVCAEHVVPAPRLQQSDLTRSEEHTSELQSRFDLVCRLLLEKKKNINKCTIESDA